MTTTTRNEAAERLRRMLGSMDPHDAPNPDVLVSLLDEALAAERRATVERIRERLADNHNLLGAEFYRLDQIDAILDEVAK